MERGSSRNSMSSYGVMNVGDKWEFEDHRPSLEALGAELLRTIGEDPDREGLRDTPRRWAKWWGEFVQYEPGDLDTTFEAVQTDQMVVVSGIRVWSLCEHHLLPFWCDLAIGYITRDKVLGLSKFARVAQAHAHRLQVQERLVAQIAETIKVLTVSQDVAVLGRGEHLCMTMRGIKSPALMTSSALSGVFRADPSAREEFLRLALPR